jgi:hypothetical protein
VKKRAKKIRKRMSDAQFARLCGIAKKIEKDINKKLQAFKP